jgi:hypothetical protein
MSILCEQADNELLKWLQKNSACLGVLEKSMILSMNTGIIMCGRSKMRGI